MMDANLLNSAVLAGASVVASEVGKIAGAEVVKQVTKDAYEALKATLASVLGRKAVRAVDKLEADPSSSSAKGELAMLLSDIAPDDVPEIQGKLTALLGALADDKVALGVAEKVAGIRLDITSGGNVRIDAIKGARIIDVASKSDGDFDFRNIDMDTGTQRGN